MTAYCDFACINTLCSMKDNAAMVNLTCVYSLSLLTFYHKWVTFKHPVFWNCLLKHREGKLVKAAWEVKWVRGMAMCSPMASRGSQQDHHLSFTPASTGLFCAGGDRLCKPPAWEWCFWNEHISVCSPFGCPPVNRFSHPLSLSCVQQVSRCQARWLLSGTHIEKWTAFNDAVTTAVLTIPKHATKPYNITSNIDKHSWAGCSTSPC